MNAAQFKCLLVFSILAVIGFGPVSITCLIGIYIVIRRPQWFIRLVGDLYDHQPRFQERRLNDPKIRTGQARIMGFQSLLGLFIIDILPLPTTAILAFFIIFNRPLWFIRTVANVYGKDLVGSDHLAD
jgi:hypothetical protein